MTSFAPTAPLEQAPDPAESHLDVDPVRAELNDLDDDVLAAAFPSSPETFAAIQAAASSNVAVEVAPVPVKDLRFKVARLATASATTESSNHAPVFDRGTFDAFFYHYMHHWAPEEVDELFKDLEYGA